MAAPDVRALVVSPPSSVWGAQLYLLDQVAPLARRGIELTLATPPDSDFARAWTERGLPLHPLPLRLHQGLRIPGTSRRPGPWSMAKSAVGVARGVVTLARVARDYDMLYSFSLRTHLETAAAGRLTRTPTALDLVDMVEPGIGQRVLRLAARLASLTVANSTATAAALGDEPDVQIIHPGIDLHRFRRIPADPALRAELAGGAEVPVVAVIGRLDAKKGIHVLVDAMTRLEGQAAAAKLVVVGDAGTGPPQYAEQLRADAARLLGDRVEFLGRRSDIERIIRAVDVLVVASASEPFGLTALEAQASGTPVVGTAGGGLPEFVEHEVTGLLVPPGDADALAAAITRILTDTDLRKRVVDEAERRANPARGIDAQLDELAGMYRRLTGTPERREPC